VARAKNPPEKDHKGRFVEATVELNGQDRREMAARLYGLGFTRPKIALALLPYLSPSKNIKAARGLLRKWEQEQAFRDLIYQYAVVKMDMEVPAILSGVTRAAKRGRVDAAKLALAVTARYTDKSEMPHEVTIHLDAVPRPEHRELSGRQTTHTPELPTSTTDVD